MCKDERGVLFWLVERRLIGCERDYPFEYDFVRQVGTENWMLGVWNELNGVARRRETPSLGWGSNWWVKVTWFWKYANETEIYLFFCFRKLVEKWNWGPKSIPEKEEIRYDAFSLPILLAAMSEMWRLFFPWSGMKIFGCVWTVPVELGEYGA